MRRVALVVCCCVLARDRASSGTAPTIPDAQAIMRMDRLHSGRGGAQIMWVRIPAAVRVGNSSTIVTLAQCTFNISGTHCYPNKTHCHGALCCTGGPEAPVAMDLCSRTSHDNGRTWQPIDANVTGAHYHPPGVPAPGNTIVTKSTNLPLCVGVHFVT